MKASRAEIERNSPISIWIVIAIFIIQLDEYQFPETIIRFIRSQLSTQEFLEITKYFISFVESFCFFSLSVSTILQFVLFRRFQRI